MNKLFNSNKFRIAIILAAILIVAFISIYRSRSTKLLDRDAYSSFRSSIEDAAATDDGGFKSQKELTDLIVSWAEEHSLEYKVDKHGNIIFNRPAVKRKKNVTPTLIAVSMNYETAADNAQVLASAASIALSDIESGRRTVIFFNDEQNLANGYKGINKKYISSKTKVIYLDQGASTYLSTGSFQQRYTDVTIPAKREDNPCDTAVRISISGIKSNVIGPGINKHPDPVSALSSLLTRLKSKSVDCRLADIKVENNGNMYPVALEATISLNSYNLASFTGYIDKRIKAWEKSYGSDYEDIVFTYEVVEDEEKMPDKVYSAETTDKLTGILYTIRSGSYRYSESDAIPEGKEVGDTYGINCITDIKASDDSIRIPVIIQGVNDSFTERILNDNKAAAELYECSYAQTGLVEEFLNNKDKLSRTFRNTLEKVNDSSVAESSLSHITDNYFTPCSYLQGVNSQADIIHIRTKGSAAPDITNTILCYIKAKGNTSIFK
ncbi:MAG: hypothetical protein IKG17_11360 [Mogibacterium sp.]|nr:hypothetical protein [Mogibacterium sp.]